MIKKIRNIFKRLFGKRDARSSFIGVFQVDDKKTGDLLGYVKAKTYESVTDGDMTKHKKTVTYYGNLSTVFEWSLLCERFNSLEPYLEYTYIDEYSILRRWHINADNVKLTKIYDYEEFTFEHVK